MRRHVKPQRTGCEIFRLVPPLTRAPPPPGFMYVRRVGGIDQTDHRVINVHVECQRMHDLRRCLPHIRHFGRRHIGTISLTDPDPDQSLAFTQRIDRHGDLFEINRIVVDKCGYGRADAVRSKGPSVIAALNPFAIDPAF